MAAVNDVSAASESEIQTARLAAEFLQHSALDRAAKRTIQGDVAAGLRACVAAAAISDAAALAHWLNVSRITAWYWLRGKSLPEFEHLAGICRAFGVPVSDLLANRIPKVLPIKRSDELPLRPSRRAPHRFDAVRIFGEIRHYLDLTREAPPSLEDVGRETGFSPRVLRRHFAVLCHEVSARYKVYCRARIIERRTARLDDFRTAIRLSRARYKYGAPTRSAIVRLLPKPGVLRSAKARQDFNQLLIQLE